MTEVILNPLHCFLAVLAWQLLCYLATWVLSRMGDAVTRAPTLDVVCSLFSWVPWIVTFCLGSWTALGVCLVAQYLSIEIFSILHTTLHGYRGPKIRHALDEVVGPWRNHTGLMVTLLIVPIIWMIRFGQLTVYPLQVLGLGFPWYRHADWVSVNRQKFQGLVGHDLVWCLYCEWVLSIYSLGAEMIRNNESWWCPIQFHDQDKCAKCVPDFPGLKTWVRPDGTMQDVKDNLRGRYCPKKTPRAWEGYKAKKP